MGIVVFDLEGVLIDNRKRFYEALRKADPRAKHLDDLHRGKRRIFWDNFMDSELAKEMDEVNERALNLWKKRSDEGYKLVILSGTKKDVVMSLIEKLKKRAIEKGFEFKPTLVIWRPEGDKRKSYMFKKQKIKEIEKLLNDEVIEIHDDDKETIETLRNDGYNAILWVDLEPTTPIV